jgi:hypothetical protein
MSKTKTLGELLDEVCQDICGMDFGSQIKDVETPGIIPMVIARVCDFPVNPGFIVTADRVEAAAKVLANIWEIHEGEGDVRGWENWIENASAAITAAGGIVPDEVVEVSNDNGDPCPKSIIFWVPGDEEYSFFNLCVGDRLYIKRKDFPKETDREEAKLV